MLSTLLAVRRTLAELAGGRTTQNWTSATLSDSALGFDDSEALLTSRTRLLFGEPEAARQVSIMVTVPSDAAHDPSVIRSLVQAGMDVMRINCAHDNLDAWRAMISNLRDTERETGRRVRICADLAGPKLRTGPAVDVIDVVKFKPLRSPRGELISPRSISLTDNPEFPVPDNILQALAHGDRLEVDDTRGRRRRGEVTVAADGPSVSFRKSVYLESGAGLRLYRGAALVAAGHVGKLPESEVPLRVAPGDCVRVLRRPDPGKGEPHCVGCTLPQALARVEPGHMLWFDDGRIGGLVTRVDGEGIDVEIRHTRGKVASLRSGKGINLPDTQIDLPALTAADIVALEALAGQIDLVGMSFVRSPEDVVALHRELDRLGAGDIGVELKIENQRAFECLPHIMLAAMRRGPFSVMVARGDLAVEVGFERLAEVQEEILWLCEAAHVPVVWATQVLEQLAKGGAPSRAEVSDAAMSERAECVMLNKGPYVSDAVHFLDRVLQRMQEHQYKKQARLRPLRVSKIT